MPGAPFCYAGGEGSVAEARVGRVEHIEKREPFLLGLVFVAGAVGLGAAVDYLQALPWDEVEVYEAELLAYGTEQLMAVPGPGRRCQGR